MEAYPVDTPEQVVRWLMVEGRLHAFDLLVSATRSFEPGELAGDERLGDEEREEVSEISEVGPASHSSFVKTSSGSISLFSIEIDLWKTR